MGFGTIGGANPDNVTLDKTLSGALEVKAGNGANQALILDSGGKIPALDGSQVTNLISGINQMVIRPVNLFTRNSDGTITLTSGTTTYETGSVYITRQATNNAAVTATVGTKLTVTGGKTLLFYKCNGASNDTYDSDKVAAAGVWTSHQAVAPQEPFGYTLTSNGANSTQLDYPLFISSTGNISVRIKYMQQGTQAGILDFLLDGVSQGTHNTFGVDTNNMIWTIPINSVAAGEHKISLKANGKNWESSAYYIYISEILIETA